MSTMRSESARHPAPDGTARLLAIALDPGGSLLRNHRSLIDRPERWQGRGDELIARIRSSGLRGRGGAGFPTGTKLQAVASERRRPIVVVNGTEGEPVSRKDATLLRTAPHLVLDGAVLAAMALGADRVMVCIDRDDLRSADSVLDAIDERRASEPGGPDLEVFCPPSRYVAGEETALVNWLNGNDARPTVTPPRPFQSGVGGRPTLVDNVETLAHLATIAQYGTAWFRGVGTEGEPGTALMTVSGAVDQPSVYEVELGTPLARLLRSAGVRSAPTAALVGGYFGSWLTPQQLAMATASDASLRPLGGGLGCGAVVVLGEHHCGVVESARVLRWMAGETAGQCGPCVHGLHAIAATYEDLAAGRSTAPGVDLERLHRWAGDIEGRGACRFPDGAIRFLRSSLAAFDRELLRHASGRQCHAQGRSPTLPVPPRSAAWR